MDNIVVVSDDGHELAANIIDQWRAGQFAT
jgi:hypothetical protein